MKILLSTIFVFFVYLSFGQIDTNTVLLPEGYITPLYKPFSGTRAQLNANTNTTYLSAQTTDYGGGNWIKISPTSLGYNENNITIVIDASGQVWKLNHTDDEVLVDWFLPTASLSDTADKTTYIQEAVIFAKDKKLKFNSGYKYVTQKINLPDNSNIDFNGATITASWRTNTLDPVLFKYESVRLNNDGTYSAPIKYGTKQNIKELKGATLKNGIFYCNNYRVDAITLTVSADRWTSVDNFLIENCVVYGAARSSFSIHNTSTITDSSTKLNTVLVKDCKSFYNGVNIALFVRENRVIGDTSINLSTEDRTNIAGRVGVGQYIQFGGTGGNSTIQSGGYGTTNKIYRIKRFTPDVNDSTSGRIDITGGSYSAANGFIDSAMGLTANIMRNQIAMPIDSYNFGTLTIACDFTGTSGSTTVSRATINAINDAYYKNMYVGMVVSFASNPGFYTITDIAGNNMTLDKPLLSSFTAQRAFISGQAGDAVMILGYILNVKVTGCTMYGGTHGVALSGSGGKGLYQSDLKNSVTIKDNDISYMWMSSEMTTGTGISTSGFDLTGLTEGSISAGDSMYSLASPANYRIGSKDINGDAIVEGYVTNAATLDANVTKDNALFVGEIIGFFQCHFKYLIADISTSGGNVYLKLRRWNNDFKITTTGGFERTTSGGLLGFKRVFSVYVGETGSIGNLTYTGNTFTNCWRPNGGGYHISAQSYNATVTFNSFNSSEGSAIEIAGYKLDCRNNKINGLMFTGAIPAPATYTNRQSINGRGAGGIGTIFSHNTNFCDNQVRFVQRFSGDYNTYAGSVNLLPTGLTLSSPELINFSGNTIYGISATIAFTTNGDIVSSGTAAGFYYDQAKFNDNKISLTTNFTNFGINKFIFSPNTEFKGNIITNPGMTEDFNVFTTATILSPLIFDTTQKYNIVVGGNLYPTKPVLTAPMGRGKIDWLDYNNRTGIPDGNLIIENGEMKIGGSGGSGGGSIKIKIENF